MLTGRRSNDRSLGFWLTFALCLVATNAVATDESPATTLEELLPELTAEASPHGPLDGHVVVVDFWASWCAPCKKSFPWMNSLGERFGEAGLRVVTINVDREEKAARRFLERQETALPVVFDPEGKLAERCKLAAMPTSLFFARDGTLALRHEGFRTSDIEELETTIEQLLEGTDVP